MCTLRYYLNLKLVNTATHCTAQCAQSYKLKSTFHSNDRCFIYLHGLFYHGNLGLCSGRGGLCQGASVRLGLCPFPIRDSLRPSIETPACIAFAVAGAIMYRVCQKSDTPVNYVNITSHKLKNTRYLHRWNNFNIHYYSFIELCAQCVHPAAVQPEYKTTTPFVNAVVNEALW